MHQSALTYGKAFFDTYVTSQSASEVKIVDVGAQDVNGSLRQFAPEKSSYIGVDFVLGKGVDIVIDNPYSLPFDTNSVDYVVCSSVYEHCEFFWLLFLESLRILKPDGLLYINAPSNGALHRYPIDAWRFYPDAGKSLVNWAHRNGMTPSLIESFIGSKMGTITGDGMWNDFVAVFCKDKEYIPKIDGRILDIDPEAQFTYALGRVSESSQIKLMPDTASLATQSHQLAEQSRELELMTSLSAENQILNQRIKQMENSKSWRYTSFLRKALMLLK